MVAAAHLRHDLTNQLMFENRIAASFKAAP